MKRQYSSIISRITGMFLFMLLITSCDESAPSDPGIQYSDSLSVKKMDADSNSDMPVAVPKDSSVTMPNAFDTDEKPPPVK